jgi:PKD repeat protein
VNSVGAGTGASVSTVIANPSTYEVTVVASNATGTRLSKTSLVTVQGSVVSDPVITTSGQMTVGVAGAFSANGASDSSGGSVSYLWSFGDGSEGRGNDVTHTYASNGSFTVTLVAQNDLGVRSNVITRTVNVMSAPILSRVTITRSAVSAYINSSVNFAASVDGAPQTPVSYSWTFGDGTSGTGANVTHSYLQQGSYTVTVRAQNTSGLDVSATVSQQVLPLPLGQLVPACSGTNCAAFSASSYIGSGTGVWQYNNTSDVDVVLDINIAGVSAGKEATFVFTNGGTNKLASLPIAGVSAEKFLMPLQLTKVTALDNLNELAQRRQHVMDETHRRHVERNFRQAQEMFSQRTVSSREVTDLPANLGTAPIAVPVLGDTKTWNDTESSSATPTRVATTARAICQLSSGRKAIFWGDVNATLSASAYTELANFVCGSIPENGAFNKLNGLLGDFWSALASSKYNYVIQDAPGALQDVNVVMQQAPGSGWAGYFFGFNNVLSSRPSYENSNAKLVLFVNAVTAARDLNFAKSTLVHEATHMINHHQRMILRGVRHQTWLEETSAMMSEDIVTPSVINYNKFATNRIPAYIRSGGGFSLESWASSNSYDFGGAFGAFLNRRYGPIIAQQLISVCQDVSATETSYGCVDRLIVANGGVGFSDELSLFGATVFARISSSFPAGFGYPAASFAGYSLNAISLSTMPPSASPSLANGFTGTTHSFVRETIGVGKTSYIRTGVRVPAKSSLMVVIK